MRPRSLMIALGCALAVGLTAMPVAGRDARDPARAAERVLLDRLAPGTQVSRDRAGGNIRALRGTRGPIATARSLGRPATAGAAARAFLADFGALYGVASPGRQLRVVAVQRTGRTGTYVHLRQELDGVPVLGGDLVVVVDRGMNVRAARGEATRDQTVDTRPGVSQAAAMHTATEAVARATGTPVGRLRAATPQRWILDPRLLDAPGLPYARLVWRTEVRDAGGTIDWFVAVDAHGGDVALRFDQRGDLVPQRVCDQLGKRESQVDRFPCTAARKLTPPYTGDAADAEDATAATVAFYQNRFGVDLGTLVGSPLITTVRYCPPAGQGDCPYLNAFWNGSQMVYGADFASADDVVGHELTHAVTERTSNLFYYMESGAINEALSDIFGEAIDLTDGIGQDGEDDRWQIGEGLIIGVIRDMRDPTRLGHPVQVQGPLWEDDPYEIDGGGVHSNSGVANHAFWSMVEGSTTLDADRDVALDKALAIWRLAASGLLTSASDYADLADALLIACDQLEGVPGAVRTGSGAASADIATADCAADGPVDAAISGAHMRRTDRVTPREPARLCTDPDATVTTLLYSPLTEDGVGWTFDAAAGQRWSVWDGYGYPDPDAPAGTEPWHLWGRDGATTSDRRVRRSASLAIPAGDRPVFLWFRHAYGFDDGSEDLDANDNRYDGGVVEVSADGGPWTDITPLFLSGGPVKRIYAGDTNPLKGRLAFSAESGGYVTARANLSGFPGLSFAGRQVRLGFRIGTDSRYGGEGWFIDDIRVYTCVNPVDTEAPTVGPIAIAIPRRALTADDRLPVEIAAEVEGGDGSFVGGVAIAVGGGPPRPFGGQVRDAGVLQANGLIELSPSTQHVTFMATDENGDTDLRTRDLHARLYQEDAFTYSAGWSGRSVASASGGSVRSTSHAGRTAKRTVTGEDLAVIAAMGPGMGKAEICVNGAACRGIL